MWTLTEFLSSYPKPLGMLGFMFLEALHTHAKFAGVGFFPKIRGPDPITIYFSGCIKVSRFGFATQGKRVKAFVHTQHLICIKG